MGSSLLHRQPTAGGQLHKLSAKSCKMATPETCHGHIAVQYVSMAWSGKWAGLDPLG